MKILETDPFNMSNGDGIRVVIWCAGCYRKCPFCFSPHTWAFDKEATLSDEEVNRIITLCDEEHIQGLTLCGGEPLAQENLMGTYKLVTAFREKFGDTKDIWSYTGYVWEDIMSLHEDVLNYENQTDEDRENAVNMRKFLVRNFIDTLIDGPFMNSKKDLSYKWRGSSNQRVIDVKKSMATDTLIYY